MRANYTRLCTLAAALLAFCSTPLRAADGVSNDKIIFGQVAALNGPAQALGQGMREGILAAFEDANRAGGVNGRKLELKSIDDGYEPEKTIIATNKAITEERVSALVGGRWNQHRRPVNPSQRRPRCRSSVRLPAPSFYATLSTATSSISAARIFRKQKPGSSI